MSRCESPVLGKPEIRRSPTTAPLRGFWLRSRASLCPRRGNGAGARRQRLQFRCSPTFRVVNADQSPSSSLAEPEVAGGHFGICESFSDAVSTTKIGNRKQALVFGHWRAANSRIRKREPSLLDPAMQDRGRVISFGGSLDSRLSSLAIRRLLFQTSEEGARTRRWFRRARPAKLSRAQGKASGRGSAR